MTAEQEKLLEMLKEIDGICRKHNIIYYLAGGTCIGAIRHKGFLPWDDDMDIYMTRANWEKFIEVSKTDFPPNRVLLCPETDSTYSNMFGRYCDTTCTSLHKHNMYTKKNEDDPCGVILDILPLDPIPYTEEFMKEYSKKLMLYADMQMDTAGYGHRYMVNAFTYLKYAIRNVFNHEKVSKELYDQLFCYEEEDCDYFAMRWGGVPLLFPKEWFQEPTEFEYEDMTAMMPTMNNAYLTMHYGDSWIYLPRIEEQSGHVAVFRMDVPYAEFRKEYETIVKHKRRRYVRLFGIIFKFSRMLRAKKLNEKEIRRLKKEGQKILTVTGCQSDSNIEKIRELLADNMIMEIEPIIKPYLDRQLSAKYIGREDFPNIVRFNYPVFMDVSDEFFELAVKYCMFSNKMHWSLRLMDLKEKTEELSEELKTCRKDILFFRDAVNDYDLKRYGESLKKTEELLLKYPKWDVLIKLKLRLILYKQVGEMGEVQSLLDIASSYYPTDGEFVKYKLDYELISGKEVDLLYKLEQSAKSISATRNGMIHLQIKEDMLPVFEEYYCILKSCLDNKEFHKLRDLIEAGSLIYTEENLSKIKLMEMKLQTIDTEDDLNEEQMIRRKEKMLRQVLDVCVETKYLNDEWKELYLSLKEDCGYSRRAGEISYKIDLADSYDELLAMDSDFVEEVSEADMLKVRGDLFYALGRTKDAEQKYMQIFSMEEVDPFINYEIKKLLNIKVIAL